MAASSGMISNGTLLRYDSGGGSYTTISEVYELSLSGIQVNPVDFSHLNSDDTAREYKPGMIEGGDVTVGINYAETYMATLYGFLRTEKTFRIVAPDSSYWQFAAFISSIGNEYTLDDKITIPITLKITGKPSWNTA